MPLDLSGVEAKLHRAVFHIQELERRLDAISDESPSELRLELDKETGRFEVYFQGVRPLTEDCRFIIGEAIHQVRSSLDHLVYELSGRPTGSEARRTRFPICRSQSDFLSGSGPRAIQRLSKKNQALIQRLQPYRRLPLAPDEDWLSLLDELWNIDKHRSILLAVRQVIISELRLLPQDGNVVDLKYYERRDPAPGALLLEGQFVADGPSPQLNVRPQIIVSVNFGESGKLFGYGPVPEVLWTFVSNVRHEVLPLFQRSQRAGR